MPFMTDSPSLTRRQFFERSLASLTQAGALVIAGQAGIKGLNLMELRETWAAAAAPNAVFLANHSDVLSGLEIGASFAPEQWTTKNDVEPEAMRTLDYAVNELGMRRLRLGVRWNRAVDGDGRPTLDAYAPYIDRCLALGAELCLNVGPIRTFRWPEEHVPDEVEASITLPAVGASIRSRDPLAEAALSYLDGLLALLRREYGASITTIQVENEPFYPLGAHRWLMSEQYLVQAGLRADEVFPESQLLLTSAGRLNLRSVRNVLASLLEAQPRLAARLISGFDYHFRTPRRDSFPIVRYFDQIAYAKPFAPTLEGNIEASRKLGYRIEVTEGQMEPYGYFWTPGNSAKDFRFLLLRAAEKVFDPQQPKLLRVWGLEELAKKALRGSFTPEHTQIVELIRTLNALALETVPEVRR
jgi:hypothetical protein